VSRRKRVERALEAIGDEITDFFTVKPKARAPRVPSTMPFENPAIRALQQAATPRPRTTQQPTRRPPPVEELAVKPGRKGFQTRLEAPSKKPVVTQAGELGIPVSGPEQMAVAHPSPFGSFSTIKPRRPASEVT
jgi:hypothetical protein